MNKVKASEDIKLIKKTIKESKKESMGLGNIFLVYGIISVIISMSILIQSHLPTITRFSVIVTSLIKLILFSIMFIFFFYFYKSEKLSLNKQYLSLIRIWGMLVYFLPFVQLITRIVMSRIAIENVENLFINLEYSSMLVNSLLFCFSIIIVATIREKKFLYVLSLVFLFFAFEVQIFTYESMDSAIWVNLLNLINVFIIPFGYVVLYFILRAGVKDGNE